MKGARVALAGGIAIVLAFVLAIAILSSEDDMRCEAPEGQTGVSGDFAKPESIPPSKITSPFGSRWGTMHNGLDIAGGAGTPIYAYADGVVSLAGAASGFGSWVVIEHDIDGEHITTVYGHMFPEDIMVSPGQPVKAGQTIAKEGYNGSVSPPGPGGAHLHFEVRKGTIGGPAVDPQPWVDKASNASGGGGEKAGRVTTDPEPSKMKEGDALPPVPESVGSEKNLQKDSIRLMRAVHQQFPEVQTIGGWRPNDPFPDHPSGRAIDVMIPNYQTSEGQKFGTKVKDWLYANRDEYNIEYMIWAQEYIPSEGAGNIMEDRGSPTQNHFDHVHITVRGEGMPSGNEEYTAGSGGVGSESYGVDENCEVTGGVDGGAPLAAGSVPSELEPWLKRAGSQCEGVDAPLLAAQMGAESGFQKGRTSTSGAQGYSQFMPGTWATWGREVDDEGREVGGPGSGDPNDPGDATMAQARYMCQLHSEMADAKAQGKVSGDTTDLTLAAYNAGPGAVLEYGGVPPYAETTAYVKKINDARGQYA